uniref:Uncharacterized protein TCIL3000_11_10900 n=1 Tax=Trypanosoma congolense (strain IL3000) TaxID=1068625 RepID=G0V1U2_TRYCI|nr:unnamed protein product [Trypanosoma congolense IL3000]
MIRPTCRVLTATPERFSILGTTHTKPKRTGFGRCNKMRSKPSDNVAWYDKGPVEWLPRPVRLTYDHLDQLQQWMMRATLDGRTEEFNYIRDLHREWSQHPLMPVLGDVEPKFPLNLFKQNHKAKKRFLVRWHKAQHAGELAVDAARSDCVDAASPNEPHAIPRELEADGAEESRDESDLQKLITQPSPNFYTPCDPIAFFVLPKIF